MTPYVVALIVFLLVVIAGVLWRIERHLARVFSMPPVRTLKGPWA